MTFWGRSGFWLQFGPGLAYFLANLLSLADLLSHGVQFLQQCIHLLLFVPQLTGEALLGGAQIGHSLRQLGELLQSQLPLRMCLLQLLGLTPEALQRVRQLLLTQDKTFTAQQILTATTTRVAGGGDYLVDVVLLLSQHLDLLLQHLQFGGGAFVVLLEHHRLFQLMFQPIRVCHITGVYCIEPR